MNWFFILVDIYSCTLYNQTLNCTVHNWTGCKIWQNNTMKRFLFIKLIDCNHCNYSNTMIIYIYILRRYIKRTKHEYLSIIDRSRKRINIGMCSSHLLQFWISSHVNSFVQVLYRGSSESEGWLKESVRSS
jgi:hypothetical protein